MARFLPQGTGNTYPRTGPGRHSSDPQHRRCGVGYYTDTQERVWLRLPGLKQSVYRAEFLAVVRAWKSASRMRLSATAKELSKQSKPCKLVAGGLKAVTVTLNREH
eukprot:272439-Amphidinium_carterae.2